MRPDATFEQVVLEHGAMVRRIAASHEALPELAEELVQDIWFAVWRSLPSFRGEGPLRGFVARIATNRSATHVARAVRAPQTGELCDDLPAIGDCPEGAAVAKDRQARLLAAVRALPLPARQVVSLTLEGFGPSEIAASLGVSANTVSIRLTRAKMQLRQLMGEFK